MTDRDSIPGMPRWVKVSGLITLAVVVLIAIMLVTGALGGGGHGPSRHRLSGDASGPPARVIAAHAQSSGDGGGASSSGWGR